MTEKRKITEERRQYQREYKKRKYWENKVKKTDTRFDKYSYKVVSENWKKLVPEKSRRNGYELQEIVSPLVLDLLDGKVCFVDFEVAYAKRHPFRTLYPYFLARQKRLRIHMIDHPTKGEYRRLLMWSEDVA